MLFRDLTQEALVDMKKVLATGWHHAVVRLRRPHFAINMELVLSYIACLPCGQPPQGFLHLHTIVCWLPCC